MRRFIGALLILLCLAGTALAQDATATPVTTTTTTESTEPTTNVNFFFVACEDHAVLDLDGFIDSGFDVYVQVFRDLGAAGTALTELLRVPVNGTFQVSPPLPFSEGQTAVFGQFASARIIIADETDVTDVMFETTTDDVQDGCAEPSFSETATNPVGGTPGLPTVVDPTTGETLVILSDSGIFRPDGGMLNQVFARQREEIVQIGARPSENKNIEGRVTDVGLIFAECDQFPRANPGRLFDTDNITIFWSWFAKTPEQVQDHINNVVYDVTLNSQSIQPVSVSPIVQLSDGNYWVFYTSNLGQGFEPNSYGVIFNVFWNAPITDGYDDYGPGTANERFRSTCTFFIEPNPYGIQVDHRFPPAP